MIEKHPHEQRRSGDFGDVLSGVALRGYFHELIDLLSNLNDELEVRRSHVDIRAEYRGQTVCRIVPYRELIHLHIGETPVWEVRIRDEAGYLDAVDRILNVYLGYAAAPTRRQQRSAWRTQSRR
jgi:hypothetical protein